MKKDIETRAEIVLLVNTFYDKVLKDKQLEYIFQNVARVNWETHLPVMYDFWENIILFTGSYQGNPMNFHKHLHFIKPLTESHFHQWNYLFTSTVNELFEGPNADTAKQRTVSISRIIMQNILAYQRDNKVG